MIKPAVSQKRSRPIGRLGLIAGVLLGFAVTGTANADTRALRETLRRETTLLRQSLYNSPDLYVARDELLRTTREWAAHRERIIGKLERDEAYNKLRQQLMQAELELRETADWAPGGHELRFKRALAVLNVKQKMRQMERRAMQADQDITDAYAAMVDARKELKRIYDDIQFRLQNDQRLADLRQQLASAY